jgi:co-chaperonin GroES (HSP10)
MPSPAYFRVQGDLSPLKDQILVYNMEQGEKRLSSGIILLDDNGKETGIKPRWCQVYKVGSEIDYVSPGEYVLVEHGKWTYGINVDLEDGSTIYLQKIDPTAILLVSSDMPESIKLQI